MKHQFTISNLKDDGKITRQNELKSLEDLDLQTTALVIADLLSVVNSNDFQTNPRLVMDSYYGRQGRINVAKIPDDLTYSFISEHLDYFAKKLA